MKKNKKDEAISPNHHPNLSLPPSKLSVPSLPNSIQLRSRSHLLSSYSLGGAVDLPSKTIKIQKISKVCMLIEGNRAMGTPFFHELKKHASYFLKEKIKTARLALIDVTPVQLLTEEATNGNLRAPDARTMAFISRAAFEIDDYLRIVEILHKRLSKFDRKQWREPYQTIILLEHLITHGPESTAEEFQCDREVIQEMGTFQYIDERGFNWGLNVRKKSERVLKLLEKGPLLKEERDHACKITHEVKGFGSFNQRWESNKSGVEKADFFRKCNSRYEVDNEHGDAADHIKGSLDYGEEASTVKVKTQPENCFAQEEAESLLGRMKD